MRVYDGASDEPISELKGHQHWPRTVAVSADGSQLASIDEKSGVRIWRTADWSLSLEAREASGTDVCFDTAGSRIATVNRWGRFSNDAISEVLKIWAIPGGQLIAEHRVAGFEFHVARFSPEGTQMACGITSVEHTYTRKPCCSTLRAEGSSSACEVPLVGSRISRSCRPGMRSPSAFRAIRDDRWCCGSYVILKSPTSSALSNSRVNYRLNEFLRALRINYY